MSEATKNEPTKSVMTPIYSILDGQFRTLWEAYSAHDLEQAVVNAHLVGDLPYEPDIAHVTVYEGNDNGRFWSEEMVRNFRKLINEACDWKAPPVDPMDIAKLMVGDASW